MKFKILLENDDFYDYGTGNIDGDDIFSTKTTGMSYYDNFLNDKDSEYMRTHKNLIGEIVMMTPLEYYEGASKIFNQSVTNLKNQRNADSESNNRIKNVITKYKQRLPLTFLDYANESQEGLHRMQVVGDLYGWDKKYPVLVINWYDEELHHKQETDKKVREIENKINKAVNDSLQFVFKDIEEFKEELDWKMYDQFKNHDYMFNQDDEHFYITYNNISCEFDISDIKIDPNKSIDDIDYEDYEDLLGDIDNMSIDEILKKLK